MKSLYKIILILLLATNICSSDVWEKSDGPYMYSFIHWIFEYNNDFYATEISGVKSTYKYTENGVVKLDTGFFSNKGIIFHLDQKGAVTFISADSGLYVTFDHGKHWKEYDDLGGDTRFEYVAIVDSTIFLQANEFSSLQKLEKGKDTLEKIYLNGGNEDSLFADVMLPVGDYIFAADPRNHMDLQSKVGKFYISKNKGKTWELSKSIQKKIAHLFFKDGTLFAFMVDDGLYRSTDFGETWETDTSLKLNVWKIVAYKDLIIACGKDIYISSDNGLTWEIRNGKGMDMMTCEDVLVKGDTIYYLHKRSLVYYSTDAGENWTRRTPMTDDIGSYDIIENKDTLFSAAGYTIYYSSDRGASWGIYSDSLYFNYSFIRRVYKKDSVFVVINDWHTCIYISTNNGNSWRYSDLGYFETQPWIDNILIMGNRILLFSNKKGTHFSSDFGETWEKYGDTVFKYDYKIYYPLRESEKDISVLTGAGLLTSKDNGLTWKLEKYENNPRMWEYSKDGDVLYSMDGSNNIFKSSNWGKNWEILPIKIPSDSVIYYFYVYNNYIFVFVRNKMYVSDNSQKEWKIFENSALIPYESELNFHCVKVVGDYIVAGSNYGVWRAKLSDLGIIPTSVESKTERNYLYTFPPYPNPAKSEVKVLFYWDINLPMSADDISIYNLDGKKIATQGNLRIDKQANYYGNIAWDCSTAEPGVYLISIKHGTEERTVKVMVE